MSDAHQVVVDYHPSEMENEVLAFEKAREVGDALNEAYPNHLWAVSWQGGVLVVKNLAISSHYGFVLKHNDAWSASELKRKALEAGGELLERANMIRGKWDGQFAQSLEGADPRFFRGS